MGVRSKRGRKRDTVPSIELSRVAVVAEYRGHALRSADIADRRRVPSDVIQGVFHRELRVGFQYFRLGSAVISHEVRSDEFIVEPFESGWKLEKKKGNKLSILERRCSICASNCESGSCVQFL